MAAGGKGVVTGGGTGIRASGGGGPAKRFSRAVFVRACYGAPRSRCWRPSPASRPEGPTSPPEGGHVPRRRNGAAFGRTPREGTAGHVATRRGLDRSMRPGGRRADPLGTAGSRAVARWLSRPGPRRYAMRRAHGPNTHAMPGAVPAPAEGAWRRNRACGRCRERHAAAAPLGGSAKRVEGITQPGCGFAGPGRDGGSPITTQLPHARPANAGRGRPLPRAGGGPQ